MKATFDPVAIRNRKLHRETILVIEDMANGARYDTLAHKDGEIWEAPGDVVLGLVADSVKRGQISLHSTIRGPVRKWLKDEGVLP